MAHAAPSQRPVRGFRTRPLDAGLAVRQTRAMIKPFDTIYRDATLVMPGRTAIGDIGVREGRIAALGRVDGPAETVRNCTGLHILPGIIDTQVHFREPGLEQKEDLASGSLAAVMGGVTSVFEMPNTNPTTTSEDALADKFDRASGRMWCDHAFFVGGSAENAVDVARLERLPGAAGIKVFIGSSTGNLLVDDEEALRAIVSRIERRASFHCEDETRLRARADLRVAGDASSHPVWRDEKAALVATERLLRIAREFGKQVHVLHVTTAAEMDVLAENKDIASVEVTPHHLTLAGPEAYERLGTKVQMNPPVRDEATRDALWRALENGVVDVLGSDHAPHTLEEKAAEYPASPSGMTGVQTLVPIMLDHVNAGRLTLERLVDLTAYGPARLFGIARKGRLAVGYDADLTVVDLGRRETISDGWIASRAGWTPYDGVEVTGWPVGTVIRGREAMWVGETVGSPGGRPILFHGTRRS